jgi:hypothetical protein
MEKNKQQPVDVTGDDLNFSANITDETLFAMEAGAADPARGIDRRLCLGVQARDIETLVNLYNEDTAAFVAMLDAIERFKEHAQALLDVAESSHTRMLVAGARAEALNAHGG